MHGAVICGLLCFMLLLFKIGNSECAEFETKSRLKINDLGYEDLVVAIGGNVEENDILIEQLKTVLTDFSRYLHTLTGFYLKNVRILVPESWRPNLNLYTPVTWETFENSDIRIDRIEDDDEGDVASAHAPYTNKPSQCGSPGRYIHLTPKFILDQTIARTFGGHSKVLVREWAKFRWGVFEESPDGIGTRFYASSTGDLEATRCSKKRKGTWQTATGRNCDDFQETENCTFVDLDTTGTDEASIMYRQYLRGVNQFCEDQGVTNDQAMIHNIEAPNQQNRHCDRKSIWQVLREHSDFITAGNRVTWLTPTFDVIKRSDGKVVLVLDRSSSMNSFNRLYILRQAAYNFITRVIPDGQRLGIVQFNENSGDSDVKSPLQTVNETSRQYLLRSVPDTVNGLTSIGAGVRNGLKVLRDGPNGKAAGGRIILITDGEETAQPNIARILTEDERKLSTITIHTIAVGPEADNNLEALANFTNGRHFHHADSSTTLFDVFSQFGFEDTGRSSSEIFSSSFSLAPGRTRVESVNVDTSIEGDVLFLVGADNIESLVVGIQRPDGGLITEADSALYTRIDTFRLIKIKTNDVMFGVWTIRITNRDTRMKRVSVVVEGGVSRTTPIVTVEARWAVAELSPPDAQTLFVTVFKGYVPVGGANVTAIVSHDDGQKETRLWDDGVGADVRANDGIYSRYITTFDGTGRYGAKVFVSGIPGTTKVLGGTRLGSTAPPNNRDRVNMIDEETGAFQRVVDGGSFKCVNNATCEENIIPQLYGPAKVTDLRVRNINLTNMEVDLVFTAPGGDLMDGRATTYTIRWGRSFEELHENFDLSPLVERTFVSGAVHYSYSRANILPKMARENEVLTLILPELGNFSYVFALTATDQYGNVSPISNFASVSAKHVSVLTEPITISQPVSRAETTTFLPGAGINDLNTSEENNNTFPWYFILVALLALILFLIFLLFFVWRRKSTKETDESTILPPASPHSPDVNAYNNPLASSVRYSSYIDKNSNDYDSVFANPEHEYAGISPRANKVHLGIENSHSPGYDFGSGTPTTPTYAVTSSKIASPPSNYAFASGIPSPAYGVSSSKLRRNPSQDRGDKYNVGFGSPVDNDDVNLAYEFEFVKREPHDGGLNQNLRHSGIVSKPYRPHDETGVKRASVAETDWKGAGGSNYNLFGVQPQKDETKEASIKSRGEKASKSKLPPR